MNPTGRLMAWWNGMKSWFSDSTPDTRDPPQREADDGTPPVSPAQSEVEVRPRSVQIIELLEANGGLMKQSAIVAETEWSDATVSRTVSELEAEGKIRKIRTGRENVITLPRAQPDWATRR